MDTMRIKNDTESLGLLILAGGQSSRMGSNKAFLKWGKDEQSTLLAELLTKGLEFGFKDIIISANEVKETESVIQTCVGNYLASHISVNEEGQQLVESVEISHIQVVADEHKALGPLSGFAAGLRTGSCMYYAVMSVDMPFIEFDYLVDWFTQIKWKDVQIFVPQVHNRIHPLAGIYHRDCGEVAARLLAHDDHKVQSLFEVCKTEIIDMTGDMHLFTNINTPLDYKLARARIANTNRAVPVVTIAASKSKTGKTTLIEGLIAYFKEQGVAVGVVKSDGHNFVMDYEGTDTTRAAQAGADAVAIASPHQYAMLIKTMDKMDLFTLSQQMPVDLVFIESRSHGVFPIIEVFRQGYNEQMISDKENLVAIATEAETTVERAILEHPGVARVDINDVASIGDWICKNIL